MEAEIQTEQKKKFPWGEFTLYLLGGFGIFTLASLGLSFLLKNESIWNILLISLVSITCLGGSFFYFGVLRKKTSPQDVGLWPVAFKWWWAPLAFFISIMSIPLRGAIGLFFTYLTEGGMDSLQARTDIILGGVMEFSWPGFLLTFLAVGIIAPISEELYFRGLLHRFFQKHLGFWLRIFLSSTLFALAHFDSLGVVASSFIMGLVIAYTFEKTKSLWMPIFIHISTNGIAVILIYVTMALTEFFA